MDSRIIKRITSIDILKGIAIITVVIGHSGCGPYISKYLSSFHMQVFFFLSGILYSPKKYQCFRDLLKRKVNVILLPFLFFATMTLIVCAIISIANDSNPYNFPNCLLGLIWGNRSIFPITGGIWFLQCLFIVEIVFWLIESHIPLKHLKYTIILFVILAYIQSYNNIYLPFSIDSAISAMVFYAIGYYAKPILTNCTVFVSNKFNSVFVSCVCLIIGGVLSFVNGEVNPRTCTYSIYFLYYLNALLTIFGLFIFACLIEKANIPIIQLMNKILIRCGRNSIVFLGFNQIIIVCFYNIFNNYFTFETQIQKGVRNLEICILTCIILYFTTFLFEKTKLRFLVGKQ